MFKLQRLEITGFKSFADYTEIVFTGNGITAVVGPNGCGKSNVSDAISWVLGEQRAKSLRGAEMKDVVFQGTRDRKPSGMAEVVLHLVRDEEYFDIDENELEDIDETLSELDDRAVDISEIEGVTAESENSEARIVESSEIPDSRSAIGNGDNGFHAEELEVERVQAAQVGSIQTVERTIKTKRHWRPRSYALDFAPGEAVSVTRRLYLSGESEYQLNGRTCRLRDIQDLFAGTGLSGAHYAIIEQGRIGQILSAKPADRRNLIEEAAGISKFRTRQRAAESRLDSARTNLGRISDIVSEIEKQANSLRRQAGKTRRYVVLQQEFRGLLRGLFAAEGRQLSALIEELKGSLIEAVEAERALAVEVSEQEEKFRGATAAARKAEDDLAETRRLHSENALNRDRADREHRYQSEQIVDLNHRLETVRGEIAATQQRLTLINAEIDRLQKDEARETAEADASRQVLISAEESFASKLDDLRKLEADLEAARGELLKHTAAAERLDEVGRQLEANLSRLKERAEGLAREGKRAEQTLADHQEESEKLIRDRAEESEKLEGLNSEKRQILAATAKARESLRQSEEALRSAETEHTRAKNRFDMLQELDERKAVYTAAVQKVFSQQDTVGVKFRGVLADFFDVAESAEKAVESLFGPHLQALVVSSSADALKVTTWLDANKTGRASVLVVPDSVPHKSSKGEQTEDSIEAALGVDFGLAKVLREVFPREMSARIVDDISSGASADDRTLADRRGNLLVAGRMFVSGREASGVRNESLLAFKRELAELKRSLPRLQKEIDNAAAKAESDRLALADGEEKTVDLQSLIIKVERGLLSLEHQEKNLRQEIDRAERHRKVVAEETAQTEREIDETVSRIFEAAAGRESAEGSLSSATATLEEISLKLSEARRLADAENAVLNEKRTAAATTGERRRSVQSALRRIENEQKELQSRLALENLELTETEERIRVLRDSISEIAGKLASAEADQDRERGDLEKAMAELHAARVNSDALNERLADLHHRAAEAMNRRAEIEVRQTEAVVRLRNINEKCARELNPSLPDLIEQERADFELDVEAVREQVDDLRQRLDNFGAINMLAVEELAEAEERLLFLTSQRQDIIDSIASAEAALREIKERSRARFKDAFEAINVNFTQYFQELFGGGRGEMTLLESEDILEAGIEVVAQPPGKRLQNILLLSGGEKAMTAIALVLAIFKYRPSPFCLLDEVDAPLDDANVGRFVNKIAEMSEKTQFIVITHNKRTMEAARALYGVTMQEAGVSKVVSVKFD